MISAFDEFIQKLFLEAMPPQAPEEDAGGEDAAPPQGPEGAEGAEMPGAEGAEAEAMGMPPPDDTVYPEELELAKLAIRALYFNIDSKDVHQFKLRSPQGREIPFEKVSDYFEKTKDVEATLGFVEWTMNKYEGVHSKWTEQPEVRGKSIIQKIKSFSRTLPEEERLDNGKRVYWTRIILNCLLEGTPSFNLNISDVNETSIKEIFRLLKQSFGTDTRGILPGLDSLKGPGTF